VHVVRPVSGCSRQAGHKAHAQRHATELCFYFVLQGQLELHLEEGPLITLGHDDSVTLPRDRAYTLLPSADLE
jgi:quercetin dioxygenase-like cupin family protein